MSASTEIPGYLEPLAKHIGRFFGGDKPGPLGIKYRVEQINRDMGLLETHLGVFVNSSLGNEKIRFSTPLGTYILSENGQLLRRGTRDKQPASRFAKLAMRLGITRNWEAIEEQVTPDVFAQAYIEAIMRQLQLAKPTIDNLDEVKGAILRLSDKK